MIEREKEIRETIAIMRARLVDFKPSDAATRLSLAMAEDLLGLLDVARDAINDRQRALELYGRLLDDLYPNIRASGTTAEYAESVVRQIRAQRGIKEGGTR